MYHFTTKFFDLIFTTTFEPEMRNNFERAVQIKSPSEGRVETAVSPGTILSDNVQQKKNAHLHNLLLPGLLHKNLGLYLFQGQQKWKD